MDTSVASIRFDERGVCQYCKIHDEMEKAYSLNSRGRKLDRLVARIKREGRGKRYDCICGVSGGRDSTYALYVAVKILGLRPLAVHFDNGWNSDIAVTNIKLACQALDVDLETAVADWEEFRDIQVAFLKASVPDLDIPTDVAILATLYQIAAKEGLRHVLNGHSFRTEGIAPLDWTYLDGRYMRSIHRRFATLPMNDFRNFGLRELFLYVGLRRIAMTPILNYLPYNHEEAEPVLNGLGWRYYGGHHHENSYSKFVQAYVLPQKFGIDRRRTEMSAVIRCGIKDRQEALAFFDTTPYECEQELIDYAIEKLGLTPEAFAALLAQPPRQFRDFPTYYPLIRLLRGPLRLAVAVGLLPSLLYYKFEA